MVTIAQVSTKEKSQWCPGCGDFGIVMGLKMALAELNIEPHNIVVASGIGCSGKTPHYLNTYGYEGLHGRVLPLASGIKLANPNLTVLAVGGDGDGYGIGAQHFVHIMRRNYDMTYVVYNNSIYGLTTGQASPTSQKGMKTKSTPHGLIESPFNPIANAIVGGASFVARTFAGDAKHMKDTLVAAVKHKGFSFVDVFQPCVSFNPINTYEFWTKRVYKLQEAGHDATNKMAAMEKAFEELNSNYEKCPIGVFYQEDRPTYESALPQYAKGVPAHRSIGKVDLSKAYKDFY